MCVGFTPNAHDAPCGKRASEFETKPEGGPRTVSQRREYNISISLESIPRVAYHTATGDERGHTGGITTARNESPPQVHNKPMNSPLEASRQVVTQPGCHAELGRGRVNMQVHGARGVECPTVALR